jgi:hypothetical protein
MERIASDLKIPFAHIYLPMYPRSLRLTSAHRRWRDGEELVEHILRIILSFDLREPGVMLANYVL